MYLVRDWQPICDLYTRDPFGGRRRLWPVSGRESAIVLSPSASILGRLRCMDLARLEIRHEDRRQVQQVRDTDLATA